MISFKENALRLFSRLAISVLATIVMLFTLDMALSGGLPLDPNEPNDDFATAVPISCPSFESTATAIDPLGDVDYYRLTGQPRLPVTIDIDADQLGSFLDSVLGTFHSDFLSIGFSDDDVAPGEPETLDSYLEVVIPEDGILFIAVSAFSDFDFDGTDADSTGPYILSVICGAPPGPPMPGDLLGSTGAGGGVLIDINPATGAGTFRGFLGSFGPVTEIEFREDGLLIGSTGGGTGTFVNIDPATGAETLRCIHQVGAINGLEFVGATLFGAHVESPGSPSDLVIVGEPDTFGACSLTFLGPTGYRNLGGLAYEEGTGTLYGCAAGGIGGGDLVTCNTMTGACTAVGPTGFDQCSALTFGPHGTLYGGIGGSSAEAGKLITIDPSTGVGTEVGPTGFPVVSGLAFVPGPQGIVLDVDSWFLSWTTIPDAFGYDIVRGDLMTLHESAGNFTSATEECLADNHPTTSFPFSADPERGQGFWFVVRDVQADGDGSYDSGSVAQVGLRDTEINASPLSCP